MRTTSLQQDFSIRVVSEQFKGLVCPKWIDDVEKHKPDYDILEHNAAA
jgi:stress-induced morphogen